MMMKMTTVTTSIELNIHTIRGQVKDTLRILGKKIVSAQVTLTVTEKSL